MKGEYLINSIGDIKDEFIKEAEPAKRRRKKNYLAAAAACICVITAGVLTLGQLKENSNEQTREINGLPIIPVTDLYSEGMGYEGLIEKDPDQLFTGHPGQTHSNISALPVFRSGIYDEALVGVPTGLDKKEMKKRLRKKVQALGISAAGLKISTDEYHASASFDLGKITVSRDGSTSVVINAQIPDAGNGHDKDFIEMIAGSYSEFFGLEKIRIIESIDLSFEGKENRQYTVCSDTDDVGSAIISACMQYGRIAWLEDTGELILWSIDSLTEAEKMGDYPLLTEEEARNKLLEGEYLTTVPSEMPGEDHIVMTELVYRGGVTEEYFIPWYRFWVELTSSNSVGCVNETAEELGLRTFGAYYVPAVRDEYLAVKPQKLHFN
ncbi:MAG: hypothetical protein IJM11_04065 [Firmicutes bacterium]|nr:hypothetical protein [Bacillota bacterium]